MREWGGPNAVKMSVILFKGENERGRDPSCMHQFAGLPLLRYEGVSHTSYVILCSVSVMRG